jgi:hypothetical protein
VEQAFKGLEDRRLKWALALRLRDSGPHDEKRSTEVTMIEPPKTAAFVSPGRKSWGKRGEWNKSRGDRTSLNVKALYKTRSTRTITRSGTASIPRGIGPS